MNNPLIQFINTLKQDLQNTYKQIKPMELRSLPIRHILISLFFISIAILWLKENYSSSLIYNGEIIKIYRDRFGIPSIYAPSRKSAMYAWGYTMAQDRLFQMSFKKRLIEGRISELFGNQYIGHDKMYRQLNLRHWADESANYLKQTSPEDYKDFEAFCNGINDQAQGLVFSSIEFRILGMKWQKWQVRDIYLLFKFFQWSQSGDLAKQYIKTLAYWNKEIDKFSKNCRMFESPRCLVKDDNQLQKQVFQKLNNSTFFKNGQGNRDKNLNTNMNQSQSQSQSQSQNMNMNMNQSQSQSNKQNNKTKQPEISSPTIGSGSNSWVISGQYTESGSPIVANDPHLYNSMPGQWYQMHISYRKDQSIINVVGSSLIGIPFIVGKSDYVAFAITTNQMDCQQLYKQNITNNSYMLQEKAKPLLQRIEKIKVKNSQDINYTIYSTHRGPLLKHFSHLSKLNSVHKNISLSWTGFKSYNLSLSNFSKFMEITQYQKWLNLLDNAGPYLPNLVLIYGTKDGHIGAQAVGSYFRKDKQIQKVKIGSLEKYDWQIAPHSFFIRDPPRGYLVHANNMLNKEYQQKIVTGKSGKVTARAERLQRMIQEKINAGQKLTMDDMKEMQLDTQDYFCSQIINHTVRLLGANNLLSDFDCNMSKNSTKATVYETFFYHLKKLLISQLKIQSNQTSNANSSIYQKFNLYTSSQINNYVFNYILEQIQNLHQPNDQNNSSRQQYQNRSNFYEIAYNDSLITLTNFFNTSQPEQWIWGKMHKTYHPHRPFSNFQSTKSWFQRQSDGQGNHHTPNVGIMNNLMQGDFRTYQQANLRQIMGFKDKSYWIVDGGISESIFSSHYKDQKKLHQQGQYLLMDENNPERQSSRINIQNNSNKLLDKLLQGYNQIILNSETQKKAIIQQNQKIFKKYQQTLQLSIKTIKDKQEVIENQTELIQSYQKKIQQMNLMIKNQKMSNQEQKKIVDNQTKLLEKYQKILQQNNMLIANIIQQNNNFMSLVIQTNNTLIQSFNKTIQNITQSLSELNTRAKNIYIKSYKINGTVTKNNQLLISQQISINSTLIMLQNYVEKIKPIKTQRNNQKQA